MISKAPRVPPLLWGVRLQRLGLDLRRNPLPPLGVDLTCSVQFQDFMPCFGEGCEPTSLSYKRFCFHYNVKRDWSELRPREWLWQKQLTQATPDVLYDKAQELFECLFDGEGAALCKTEASVNAPDDPDPSAQIYHVIRKCPEVVLSKPHLRDNELWEMWLQVSVEASRTLCMCYYNCRARREWVR